MERMRAAAAEGRFALQRCAACGTAQYPPRAACHVCLSDLLGWDVTVGVGGQVLARTVLYHSNEPRFRDRLPLAVGLVRLDAGPVVVCFLANGRAAGDPVCVRVRLDEARNSVLEAS